MKGLLGLIDQKTEGLELYNNFREKFAETVIFEELKGLLLELF